MSGKPTRPTPPTSASTASDPSQLGRRVTELRAVLLGQDPFEVARRTGCIYSPQASRFSLHLLQQELEVSYPELVVYTRPSNSEAPVFTQALLLYYFSTADGSPLAGRWISFSELPNGRFYAQAFQGYTGAELARAFREDLVSFEKSAASRGGQRLATGSEIPGDFAFYFSGLPRLPLLVAAWQGDEDFPASFQVLFDGAASHYLPTDGCAILASSLVGKLISARP